MLTLTAASPGVTWHRRCRPAAALPASSGHIRRVLNTRLSCCPQTLRASAPIAYYAVANFISFSLVPFTARLATSHLSTTHANVQYAARPTSAVKVTSTQLTAVEGVASLVLYSAHRAT
ncbi:hypothetical protein MSAN_00530700 [Mycena sanguinolenta]|uniref:Uncharacterized protein n=1 Tax=Mycena sanguinolenta TaxID=230812 RepID=A0A8H6Z9P1_9AGAR|nr:hypothetical protein MSAN_00530700 [Mycena sanguinolenta]